MINKILNRAFWKTRASLWPHKRDKWILVIFISVFIPLFLIIFQPYGVNNYDPTHKIRWSFVIAAIGFGLVNGLILAVYEFIISPFLFKKITKANIILKITLLLVLLASGTYLFYNILGNFHDWNIDSYVGFIRDVTLMGIIPLGMAVLFFSWKKSHAKLKKINANKDSFLNERGVTLTSKNEKEQLILKYKDLWCIEASDNYVTVYYHENGKMKKYLMRITMKDIASQLYSSSVIRCHRSYMVNTLKIQNISKKGNQVKIQLPELAFSIPVSLSYLHLFRQYFQHSPQI